MRNNILARRYANAIYMFTTEKELDYNNILNMMKIIDDEISNNPQFLRLLENTNIKKNDKMDIVNKILEKYSFEKNIIDYLITKDRILLIHDIVEEYTEIYNIHNNILKVEAVFAKNISETQKDKLIKNLESKYNKQISLNIIIDEKIIGGGIIKVNDEVIDGSYKNQLLEMTKLF